MLDNVGFVDISSSAEACLHIITRRTLLIASNKHSGLYKPLDAWYRAMKRGRWYLHETLKTKFASADAVGLFTVFNIKGNAYRLITEIDYRSGRVFVRHILTHSEYDKGGWK